MRPAALKRRSGGSTNAVGKCSKQDGSDSTLGQALVSAMESAAHSGPAQEGSVSSARESRAETRSQWSTVSSVGATETQVSGTNDDGAESDMS